MNPRKTRIPLLNASLLLTGLMSMHLPAAGSDDVMTELIVTSQRRPQPLLDHAGNIERLDASLLDAVSHHHVHELLTRVAGVWLSRGSGQEHLTAIRSPVLSGAGSCGAFLFLEDGIPIRPAGFCNVNSLFEANTEQADAIEVLRGPGNALYGANALHGVVNVLMPMPEDRGAASVAVEIGANDFVRARAFLPTDHTSPWLAAAVIADDGGFRKDSGYRQGKLHIKRRWDLDASEVTAALSYTDLDQDTAGFVLGRDAYEDRALARSNPNPEAFREASALRLYAIWKKAVAGAELDVRPYARYSDMRFLQHFLPGQPLEENRHGSAGALLSATFAGSRHSTVLGMDVEWSDMRLRESQDQPTAGSAFLMETRPAGKHYDYTASGLGIAAYLQSAIRLADRLELGAGLRIEHLRYDYRNHMLSGNTRDDGTPCGFGGCLYTRPEDRADRFTDLAPKLSLSYALNSSTRVFAVLARGFRPPQATELYRLQSGQETADLDSETLDSLEVGIRQSNAAQRWDLSAYSMRKRDSVFRDAEGFNINGGRSRHQGLEFTLDRALGNQWRMAISATYARHRYDFNAVALRGETFVAGRDVDTAPRWSGSIDLQYALNDDIDLALQWTGLGAYYLDAENRFTYPGHNIANLRAGIRLTDRSRLTLRLNNLMDRAIADRADYAFGEYRYFPGRGRELFAEYRFTP